MHLVVNNYAVEDIVPIEIFIYFKKCQCKVGEFLKA